MRKLVTTPIFYVNGGPHVGHASSMVLADACARWLRMQPPASSSSSFPCVVLSSGADEHGAKVARAASERGETPAQLCARVAALFESLAHRLDVHDTNWGTSTSISTSDEKRDQEKKNNNNMDDTFVFVRTSEERHKRVVRAVWSRLAQRGHVVPGSYAGYYCQSDESFVPLQRTLPSSAGAGRVSAESGHAVEWLEEATYQLPLAPFAAQLRQWAAKEGSILPTERQKEVVELMLTDEALAAPLSISRPSSRSRWGIQVPDEDSQTIYVWLDALCNYLTVAGFDGTDESLKQCWPPHTQIVGKDILRFHCVVWPAMLFALGLEPPRRVIAHGHWTSAGIKMSKSLNNVVDPIKLLDEFGSDAFRYFLLAELNLAEDSSFVESSMREKLYNDLADTLGNLIRRCTAASLNPSRIIPAQPSTATSYEASALLKRCNQFGKDFAAAMDTLDTRIAASLCMELARGKRKRFLLNFESFVLV